MKSTDKAVQTDNLTKFYGKTNAVNKVSLAVNKGEIYGFLGLNGAGKTTTIQMLLGMIKPSFGASYIYGKKVNAGNYQLWKNIGYLVETPYAYPEMTVYENLKIARYLHGLKHDRTIDEIIEKLHLSAYKNRKAGELSLGNKQRLGLAKALIHNPEILILDEPTNGLDPAGIFEIRELLNDLSKNKGVTIFISSHILAEISKLATCIGIIHEGRLLQELGIDKLNKISDKRLVIGTKHLEKTKLKLLEEGYKTNVNTDGNLEITDIEAIENPENIASMLVYANMPPGLLKVEKEDMESYFLKIINGGKMT
jgi:ABC-2 type transport system ATP-binding protein